MIQSLWAAYRRYFLNHLPAHFTGFVMGAAYGSMTVVLMLMRR